MSHNLIFYYFPRACSLASHIALEETGMPYEARMVNINEGENKTEEYLAVNPLGKVPALQIDGKTLTENQAILCWIADTNPDLHLLPQAGDPLRYRAHEIMSFFGNSFHPYIRSIFRSSFYAGDDEAANICVGRQGLINLGRAVHELESQIKGRQWTLDDKFSLCDAYLFIMYLWTTDERIEQIPDRPNMETIARNVWQRPAVQKVVAREREFRPYPIPASW